MQFVKNFDSLFDHLTSCERRLKIAVVCPHDDHTCEAIDESLAIGFADFVLVGDPAKMRHKAGASVLIIDEPDADKAALRAVELVREGQADVLMKGLINTDNLLRAVLNKQHGLLPEGGVLSHITCAQIPGQDKLLFFSDAAVIPFPTLDRRIEIIKNMVSVCRSFGIEQPRIALIHCSEKISPKFPITTDYVEILEQSRNNAFGNAIIDGPMDVKTACDASAAAIKGISSPIGGQADCLMFPDIESANVFYKTISTFAHSLNAGMLMGTMAPVVLPSRSDSTQSKLCSLAMACLAAKAK